MDNEMPPNPYICQYCLGKTQVVKINGHYVIKCEDCKKEQ